MADDHDKHGGGDEAHAEGHGGGGHGGGGHGPGGGSHEEHAGAPEWLISFADNVALLMGFFVILLAMNMKEKTTGGTGGKDAKGPAAAEERLDDFVVGIRQAFNNPVSLSSDDPRDGPLIKRMKQRQSSGTSTAEGTPGKNAEQQAVRPSDYNRTTAVVAFDQSQSLLTAEAKGTLIEAAKRLRGQRFIVELRGHASAMEAALGQDAAMKLGFARALAAAAVMAENGLTWSQIRVVSAGDHDRMTPIAEDPGGHRSNQRVEVVVTDDTVAADPHTKEQR
ncbi:MAG: OmpA family protein [Phycisphaerales bacterium]